MKKLILSLSMLSFIVLSVVASANEGSDTLEFKTDAQRSQYQQLTEELRCPKCQNQNIADSNAPIAKDLRNEVHRLILEGDDADQIVDFMVERYGNFVVYKPKFDPSTYLLWLGPAIIALIGLIIVVLSARKKRKEESTDSAVLSQEEKNQLSHILSEDEK
ncbi:cytochrome c-type biogenesis protein [Alkalimarinus alittae]|uniref:Cytochrome c-type biogenesis protein n=1 Tax=Alkalimarinus alittae TaxID=2961619 RepID=A0ABY6MYM0_9ALTE|nr:cytochrome c-type biogenesis protein [Alkalimarinus alittae]UZE94919.1 cytochrome c-type biogenesis protein CcmH [Alkalimarinus alittae]